RRDSTSPPCPASRSPEPSRFVDWQPLRAGHARLPILWGAEFAAKGQLAEIQLEEFGFKRDDFWSGALKSVTWNGKLYGVPTNNETMAFIWNKDIFKKAGLDPDKPPATWDDVVKYSAQIKKATGKAEYLTTSSQVAGGLSGSSP